MVDNYLPSFDMNEQRTMNKNIEQQIQQALQDIQNKKEEKSGGVSESCFVCQVCGALVVCQNAGSRHRNHCPFCLSSVHLDHVPGDRASCCGGIMDPVGVWVRKNGEWALIHRCRKCGVFHSNRIAADDNPLLLMSIAAKPLASPPFPLDRLTRQMSLEKTAVPTESGQDKKK